MNTSACVRRSMNGIHGDGKPGGESDWHLRDNQASSVSAATHTPQSPIFFSVSFCIALNWQAMEPCRPIWSFSKYLSDIPLSLKALCPGTSSPVMHGAVTWWKPGYYTVMNGLCVSFTQKAPVCVQPLRRWQGRLTRQASPCSSREI